jgi:glutamate-1-semialdehyde 2,1-aminomutase
MEARGARLMDGIRARLSDAGIPAVVAGFSTIFHVAFGLTEPARNWNDLLGMDRARYVAFTAALLARGVRALERGAWFLSTEHDDSVIDATLDAVAEASRKIR